MRAVSGIGSLGIAVVVTAVAIASMAGLSGVLRKRAMMNSHQQPALEQWFQETMPTSPQLVATGRKLFLDSCAHCHAADARGDEGPDLHDVQVSDRYIGNIITHGIPHEMPSFAKKLGRPEITALTAYVRSLEGL